MSTLRTYDLEDIVAIHPGGTEAPGNMVRHVNDNQSVGVVVAHDPRPQGFAKQPQVTVLWTREPQLQNVGTTNFNRRPPAPMSANWEHVKDDPFVVGDSGMVNRKHFQLPELRGEEEYGPGDLDIDQIEQLHAEGNEVELRSDGRVVVKRKASELPEYLRRDDGGFNSSFRR